MFSGHFLFCNEIFVKKNSFIFFILIFSLIFNFFKTKIILPSLLIFNVFQTFLYFYFLKRKYMFIFFKNYSSLTPIPQIILYFLGVWTSALRPQGNLFYWGTLTLQIRLKVGRTYKTGMFSQVEPALHAELCNLSYATRIHLTSLLLYWHTFYSGQHIVHKCSDI